MNKDTIIKVLLAIIALMVFEWLWRIINGMLIGTLVLTTSQLYGKHNNSNRKHNLNDKRNQHRQLFTKKK